MPGARSATADTVVLGLPQIVIGKRLASTGRRILGPVHDQARVRSTSLPPSARNPPPPPHSIPMIFAMEVVCFPRRPRDRPGMFRYLGSTFGRAEGSALRMWTKPRDSDCRGQITISRASSTMAPSRYRGSPTLYK